MSHRMINPQKVSRTIARFGRLNSRRTFPPMSWPTAMNPRRTEADDDDHLQRDERNPDDRDGQEERQGGDQDEPQKAAENHFEGVFA